MLKAIRQRIHLSQREEGFTLVELVVAMVIIAGVLMALIAVQITASTTIIEARKREQATAIGNQAMEQMRAIPWAYLSKGMYNGFATVAGDGPPLVSGGTLTIPSGNKTLIIAPITGNQDKSNPRLPLFDDTGSNKQVIFDAAMTNTEYVVRAFVAQPAGGGINTVDLVVLVDWTTNEGVTARTVVESTAYRGTGCGDETTSPFLAACQAYFDASATSGQLSTSVRATDTPPLGTPAVDVNLLYPTSNEFMSLTMRSATAAANAQAQQVTLMTGAAVFGGTVKDDADTSTEPAEQGWTRGYAIGRVSATNDVTQSNTPLHVASTTLTQSSAAEDAWSLAQSGHPITFTSRSDFRRPATAMASSTASCKTGIPAAQSCAISIIGNNPSIEEGSGYILMTVNGQIFRLSRRLAEAPSPAPVNADEAWVARFSSAASTNAAVGCQTVTGAGCISAGATRTMARLSIGHIVAPGVWGSSAAPEGIAVIEGKTGCTAGFTETVLAQRGSSQKATAGTFTRCGQLRYWSGTAYVTVPFTQATTGVQYNTTAVTWTSGAYSVTASANIQFSAGNTASTSPDPNCAAEACSVSVQSGGIDITVSYLITAPTGNYTVVSVTSIDGPSANLTYREAPVA